MPRRKLGVKNNPIKEKVPFLQKINIWKWLFLGLVSLLLAFAIVVQGRLATPREDVSQLHQAVGTKDVKVGTMTTTRDQLNDTIKSLLKKYKLSDYKVYADNQQILLEGTVEFLREGLSLIYLLSTIQVGKREHPLDGEGFFSRNLSNSTKDGFAALEQE